MNISNTEELYARLKKRKKDYVFEGDVVARVSDLLTYTQSNQETLMWYLGGPIFWVSHWLATKKHDEQNNISKIDRKIISILNYYEVTIKNGFCIMLEKE